jgi:hypothetical protein
MVAQGDILLDPVDATASLGTLSLSTAQNITPATVLGTSALGTVSVIADQVNGITADALTGSIGTVTVVEDITPRVNVSDLAPTGVPGATYSDFTRGAENVTVDIEAVTATASTREFDAWTVYHEMDGDSATGSVGTLTPRIDSRVTLATVVGTSSFGTIALPQTQVPTGVEGSAIVGGLGVQAGGDTTVDMASVSATGSVGTLSTTADAITELISVLGTTSLGTITPSTNIGGPVTYTKTYTRLGLHGGARAAYEPFTARFGGKTFILGTTSVYPSVNGDASITAATGGSTTITPASLAPVEINTDVPD